MNFPRISTRRLMLSLLVLFGLGMQVACGGSSSSDSCTSRDDCARDEVCRDGACAPPASDGVCADDNACPRFEVCVSGFCAPEGGSSNTTGGTTGATTGGTTGGTTGATTGGTTGGTTGATTGGTTGGSTGRDREPPQVVSVVPEQGATGIPVDAVVTITFSEALRDLGNGWFDQKIMIQRADTLEQIASTAAVDDSGAIMTVTPTEPLQPSTPYQVTVDSQLTDLSGNRLPDVYRWLFSTASYDESAYEELALRYAPVVYQEIDANAGIGRSDYFSSLDFDGDFDAGNNYDNVREEVYPAEAYWGVVETRSHYIIQYLFYYPSNYNENTSRYHAHDVTATQVIVTKGDGEAFVMAEASTDGEPYFGFAVAGSGVSDRNQGQLVKTFPADQLWDGTHYEAYHGKNFHGSCHWEWQPNAATSITAPWCNHEEGRFLDDASSIAYYPSMTGQPWIEANCSMEDMCNGDFGISCMEGVCRDGEGQRALTYGLRSFLKELWARRIALDGDTNLFGSRSTYRPHEDSGERPAFDAGVSFPVTLAVVDDSGSRGTLPFIWDSNGSISNGQWWVDPAWSFSTRFDFGDAEFSLDYCFNPYFAIDERGSEGCE